MRRREVEQDTALAGLGVRSPGSRAGPKPPGHTRVPCEELADGKACRPGRTMSGTARVSRRKRGPDPVQRRRWSAERRRTPWLVCALATGCAFSALHPLGFSRGKQKAPETGAGTAACPGPQRIRAMALVWAQAAGFSAEIAPHRCPIEGFAAFLRCLAPKFLAISARFPGRGEAPLKRPSSTLLCRRERFPARIFSTRGSIHDSSMGHHWLWRAFHRLRHLGD
jgi:hypothetical protein